MIHRIYSDLPTFKGMRFAPGLNILLADKTRGATDRQTRNAAGKTSTVEIIHFLLGSECLPPSVFRVPELNDRFFGMEFDLRGSVVDVRRSGGEQGTLEVGSTADTSQWPLGPTLERKSGRLLIKKKDWRSVLGERSFGLQTHRKAKRFSPTYRSLISYFVRRQAEGGFASPVKHMEAQSLWDQQVAVTFLLGLDWVIPQQWQEIRKREKSNEELRRAARSGDLRGVIGRASELRTQLALAGERAKALRTQVLSFRVELEYHELERRAADLTRAMGDLADGNTLDLQLVGELESSLQSEVPPPLSALKVLYEDAEVVLPEVAFKRFEEVRRFHESVLSNRKSYLRGELEAARQRIASRELQQNELDAERSGVMAILQSSGALEQYDLLRSELSILEGQEENLRQRFATAEKLEGEETRLQIERARLRARLQQDHSEQAEVLRSAIVAFEDVSNNLYEKSGSLEVRAGDNGPEFTFPIQGARSKGISNMQIFCFDMMIARLCSERKMGPGFLVHDSHLFDGVDSRQVAKALQVGSQAAEEYGFQYIVTMNSDAVPSELPDGFSLDGRLLDVRLTDATENGGVFGIRFG